MERPELKKHDISLSYGVSKDSAVHSYTPTISQEEDNTIRQWVNDNYALYSDTYKDAAYRDAQQAVLNKKANIEKKAILQKERKERAEKAAYQGNDKMLNQQKQLAAAENAISDAAELIRQGQEKNGVKVDKSLTDRETVNAFLDANTEMPFAEYVNKFLDVQAGGGDKTIYDNRWLAAKLGLAGKVETAWVNATDKIRTGTKGAMQGLADPLQNTLGGAMEWVGGNIGAGLGEAGYWIADKLGADVSEGTAWDKMKQAKGYGWNKEDWKKAQAEANSEEMRREGTLSENEGAFDVGRAIGQLGTEIALTAPLEIGIGSRIAASSAPGILKFLGHGANTFAGGLAFQLADDAAEGELSGLERYMETGTISTLTAGLFSALTKIPRVARKGGYKLFAPKGQDETALLTQTTEDWAKKTNINKSYAKNKNAIDTPYTEIAKDLESTAETTYGTRVKKGAELEKAEGALRYEGTKVADKYTAKNVMQDLESAFSGIGGKNAKMPKFTVNGKTLTIDPEGLDTLNKITRTQDGVSIKLGDEIMNAWENRFVRMDKPINAEQTKLFIDDIKNILGDAGYSKSGGETIRAMRNALNGTKKNKGIVAKFEGSLKKDTLENLNKAKTEAGTAISTDENLNKLVGVLRNESLVGQVGAAEKALGGKAAMEQLFKEIYEKYGIDMNNEILAWAYNMSLYDVKKAEEILTTFYPSKPGIMELLLRQITKSGRRKAADTLVEKGAEGVKRLGEVSPNVGIVGGDIGAGISASRERPEE